MVIKDANNPSVGAEVSKRVQTPTGNVLQVQIGPGDPISNIPVVMEFEHHQVHEGETHEAQYVATGLALTTIKFAIVIPTNIYPHMLLGINVYDGSIRCDIYEGATFTGGVLLNNYNVNRNSSIVPSTAITSGVTSTDGTLMPWSAYVGAGNNSANESRSSHERILKAGTTYRIDIIGLAAQTNGIIHFRWYEDLGV